MLLNTRKIFLLLSLNFIILLFSGCIKDLDAVKVKAFSLQTKINKVLTSDEGLKFSYSHQAEFSSTHTPEFASELK